MMAAVILIIVTSFYHVPLAELFSFSSAAESSVYQLSIFSAAAIGGYGVVVTVFGLLLASRESDARIRIMPLFIGISALILFFFYLLSSSLDAPFREDLRRIRPGESITL
jgi:hypothetical protein